MDGALSVSALARNYEMSVTAVQKHVAVLDRAGLVAKHRRGREQLVRTDLDAIHAAQQLLDRFEVLWRDRIDRFTDVLDDTTKEPSHERHRHHKDPEQLTMTIVMDLDAPVARAWQLWSDPRQARALVGPADLPGHLRRPRPVAGRHLHLLHDRPGGRPAPRVVEVVSVDPPHSLEIEDGFADERRHAGHELPVMAHAARSDRAGRAGATMTLVTTFASIDGHGADPRDGHGGGHPAGDRADGRRSSPRTDRPGGHPGPSPGCDAEPVTKRSAAWSGSARPTDSRRSATA